MNARTFDNDPGLDGPAGPAGPAGSDYSALVIEWEDDEAVTAVIHTAPRAAPATRTLATVVGALAALAFATWGIRRLHAA